MYDSLQENVAYEFVITSPAVLSMIYLSYLNSLFDRSQRAVELLFSAGRGLLPRFLQNNT